MREDWAILMENAPDSCTWYTVGTSCAERTGAESVLMHVPITSKSECPILKHGHVNT